MSTITTKDGTEIYYKDWGKGQPYGYRCIAHDRRGHGRSGQPWPGNDMDTYGDDLAAVVQALDLKDAIHVGHSTGGVEVARYVGRHGTARVAKAVLIGAITPLMLKTPANPGGTPLKVYEGAPHGMCTTHKERVNGDLLSFIRG